MMANAVLNGLLWGNVALVTLTGVVFAAQFRRRLAAKQGYNVWRAVLAAPLLVITCSIGSSIARPLPSAPVSRIAPSIAVTTAQHASGSSAASERGPADIEHRQRRTVVQVVIEIWALGVLLGIVRMLRNLAAMRAVYRRAQPLRDEVRSRLGPLAQTSIECFISSDVHTPVVIGYFKPRIILPEPLPALLSVAALRQVLKHEILHVASHDNVSILAERFIALLLWFNPAAGWVAREIAFYRELRCDEPAMESSPSRYMRTLLTISQFALSTRRHADLSSAAVRSQTMLQRRLATIAQGRVTKRVPRSAIACAGVFVLASALGAIMAAPPVASGRTVGRDASLSYFLGRWTCYDGARGPGSAPIGIASFAPMKDGMLEKNQSLGGTWTFRSTASWHDDQGEIRIQGSSNVTRRFDTHFATAIASVNVYKGLRLSAAGYRNTLVANSVSEFDSQAAVYSHSRWYTVQHAICERS